MRRYALKECTIVTRSCLYSGEGAGMGAPHGVQLAYGIWQNANPAPTIQDKEKKS